LIGQEWLRLDWTDQKKLRLDRPETTKAGHWTGHEVLKLDMPGMAKAGHWTGQKRLDRPGTVKAR
jgi:hypothetical protein